MKKIKKYWVYLWLFFWVFLFTIWGALGFFNPFSSYRDIDYITHNTDIMNTELQTAYFAGGCFWCMEGIFEAQDGVSEAIVWYIWGSQETANYKDVSSGTTQHREAVKILYAPDIISYEKLVELFWTQIDPTDAEGQFADKGYQYTTAIFYWNDEERNIAEASKKILEDSAKFDQSIATLILPVSEFYEAESYHQDYYKKSAFRYNLYKRGSWREGFIEENWTERIAELSEATYSDDVLREKLTPLQYKVTQEWWTERAFNNEYWDNKEDGIYVDIIDGTPLYSSLDKYESGTGWPSFVKPIAENVVSEYEDNTLFSKRTEIRSTSSDAHLGHVFPDGPEERGWLRYCMNSAALRFIPVDDLEQEGYGEYIELFQ